MFHKYRKVILLFFIVAFSWFFRFNNDNWDNGYHLHPDERFLTMVSTAMKLPTNLNEYFNQKISLLNPSNIGYKFFVYGNFPLVINKYLAISIKADNYNQLTILGRELSALFDLLVVILVFNTVLLFEKKYKLSPNIKYWSAFIYAISVLPIQLSHFFAVDTFLNFFMFGSLYFVLRKKNILSAFFFGLALACKVTALFILPLLVLLIFLERPFVNRKKIVIYILFILVSYLTLRLADPYYFQSQSFFNPTLNNDFVSNLQSLKLMTVKDISNWYPPMVQWLSKNTVLHSLVNNVVFGMGIPMTIFLIIGIFNFRFSCLADRWAIFSEFSKIKKQIFDKWQLLVMLLWVFGFFAYQSLQTTPTLRYFIFLYPFFAIFAGIGVSAILNKVQHKKILFVICNLVFVIFLLVWPLMFSSIYFHKNTRVEASEWIYKNLPKNSYILSEYWDDALPMPVANSYGKTFSGSQLKVFDPDTPEKWQIINQELTEADYYILSSNRGWGSIPTVQKKYPLMSKFYDDLLNNKNTNYKKIKEFTSYPEFKILNFEFQINDDWSDEGFTVYDHPKVLIYKNVKKQ